MAQTALTINNQFNLVLHSAILHAFSFITIANIVVVVLIIVPVVLIRLWHMVCVSAITGNIVAVLLRPHIVKANSCQEPACVYNTNTMSSAIDFKDCFITSIDQDTTRFQLQLSIENFDFNSDALGKIILGFCLDCQLRVRRLG